MRKITFVLVVFFLFTSSSSVYAAVNISVDSYPSSVIIGQEFSISITANNLSSGTSYYIKGRIGINSDLNKAETNNINNSSPDDWLADTDSWSKFPEITVGDNISTWSGTLKLRAKSTATDGQNSLKVRIKKTTTDTSYDSEVYEITLQPAPTPTSTPTPTSVPTAVPASNPTAAPTSVPSLTASRTPTPTATSKPTTAPTIYISPTPKSGSPTPIITEGSVLGEITQASITPEEEKIAGASAKSALPVFLGLLGSGLLFIVAAAVVSIKQIKSNQKTG